jgi:hypothetical protein
MFSSIIENNGQENGIDRINSFVSFLGSRVSPSISFDQIFSDWIFIWVFIYLLASKNKDTPISKFIYNNTNPILMLYVAFLDNICILFLLLYYNATIFIIIKYIFIIFILKIIPIYFLRNTKINYKMNILFSFFFFFIFSFYLYFFYRTDFFTVHENLTESLLKDDYNTPYNYFIHQLSQ